MITTVKSRLFLLMLCCSQNALASEHTDEAKYLKQAYLKNNHFVEHLPASHAGQATAVSKHLSSHFSSHSDASITGTIRIGELHGRMRLKVASSDNLLYQQQTVRVRFTATSGTGTLHIYSPVDMDFWQMAKLFIDTPDRHRPDNDPWKLKGFVVHTIAAGETVSGQATLVPMADEYLLILGATDTAEDVLITLK